MWLLALALFLATTWTLAYHGAGAVGWTTVVLVGLGVLTFGTGMPIWAAIPLWLIAGVALSMLAWPKLRQRFLTGPLLRQFRKVMPPMSRTEREALEAGSVWWDGELFSGRPDWSALLATPTAHLSAEEQAFLDGPARELCEMLDDWEITHERQDLPPEAWRFIREQGFLGLIIPREYGGKGFSAYAHSQVVMKLASRSVAAAVTVMVPNSLGPGKLLLHYGTEAQRGHYLPLLANGDEIPCFALTGPDAGSDAGAIPDTGVVCEGEWRGETVLGVRLNWDKRYITLGPVATLIGLAFKLYDPDHLLGEQDALGITLALIPRDTSGVEIGDRHVPLDIPFQNGPNRGRDVFIPMDQLIGGTEYIGQGWRMLVECLAEGRGISLPALSVGAAKTAARYTGAYAAIRQQFGLSIGRFEGIQEPLARIAALTYKMDAARVLTLSGLDLGQKPSVISAIVKYHLTEGYRQIINDAMDIQGGSGICLGPSNLIGRAYQAIPIAITVEGANILTRSMIIFGQGAIRCHPWILKEMRAARNKDRRTAVREFDRALTGHVGYLMRNLARTFFLGITRGRLSNVPVSGPTRRYYQRLNWLSAALALCADVAMMTLAGALKRKERLSARLGDVLSELYLLSAVLKRFEDQGRPEADLPLLRWAFDDGLYRIQESLRLLLRNLPSRALAWLLRLVVFPSGIHFTEPDDRAGSQAAKLLLSPSDARERLTHGVFITTDPAFREGQIEEAFELAHRVEPIEQTLRAARKAGLLKSKDLLAMAEEAVTDGILDASELAQLQQMQRLRARVVAVDAHSDYGKRHVLDQLHMAEQRENDSKVLHRAWHFTRRKRGSPPDANQQPGGAA